MSDQTDLAVIPAGELPELLDMVLWNMSGEKDVLGWLAALRARPDTETPDVQAAIAACEDYLNAPMSDVR